jgi:hypothetical protein
MGRLTGMTSQASPPEPKTAEVFDVANWLDRTTPLRPGAGSDYEPRHRADGPPD